MGTAIKFESVLAEPLTVHLSKFQPGDREILCGAVRNTTVIKTGDSFAPPMGPPWNESLFIRLPECRSLVCRLSIRDQPRLLEGVVGAAHARGDHFG